MAEIFQSNCQQSPEASRFGWANLMHFSSYRCLSLFATSATFAPKKAPLIARLDTKMHDAASVEEERASKYNMNHFPCKIELGVLQVLKLFDELREEFPRSDSLKRLRCEQMFFKKSFRYQDKVI